MAYTISQLAKRANVPVSTLRYYERVGLLKPEERTSGNYRLYSERSLSRLDFIRASQATGFSLDDVRTLLEVQAEPNACRDVQRLIELRLDEIRSRLKDLRRVEKVLETTLDQCRRTTAGESCRVIVGLKGKRRSKGRPASS